jgi:hypothetical protein
MVQCTAGYLKIVQSIWHGNGMIYLFAMPTAGKFTGGADEGII